MELRQLRYLEAVVRHSHFTRAAEELHVAQSALSHQVARLELELGVELLTRTTRSVAPTEAGTLVAARARAILAETTAIRAEVDELRGLVRGRVTVGAMLFGGQLEIPTILGRFTRAFPAVDVQLREGTVQRMRDLFGEGTLDVAFVLEAEPPPSELERMALSSEELVVAAGEVRAVGPHPSVRLQELAGARLIAFTRGSSVRKIVDTAFAGAGVAPRIAFEANDLALVRSLVARGVGLAVLPRSFVERPGPEVSYRSVSPPLRMTVALWWHRRHRLSPAARAFVDFVAEHRPRT